MGLQFILKRKRAVYRHAQVFGDAELLTRGASAGTAGSAVAGPRIDRIR